MIGLETTVGLIKKFIIDKGYMSWADVIRKMTINPARILKLPGGRLQEGSIADITIIDPDKIWTVREKDIRSLSKNTPFIGWKLSGCAHMTLLGGKVVFER
jgi:dihydroorotase